MKNFIFFLILHTTILQAQIIEKPLGCYAGTNGTNSLVLAHQEVNGVLITEKWSNIEITPGVYDFTSLYNKINTVKNAGLKYALAISTGSFGSPDWLIDSFNVDFHSFQYQNQTWRLPLWWDTTCVYQLNQLIYTIGNEFATDSMLSHVYVSQMTVNGIEGHLNGVNMLDFTNAGYTDQKWIDAAKATCYEFANAFPNHPIVFEVHEINQDTLVPATIINELSNDSSLCNRFGLGMWWISGKTSYQTDLIDFIDNYSGDKYAQIIGRSDQIERFNDSIYSSVFTQAKLLNIRYIEPWPYEFQYQTNDSLFHDFNEWAAMNFNSKDTCAFSEIYTNVSHFETTDIDVFPNPTKNNLYIDLQQNYTQFEISIYNLCGQELKKVQNLTSIDVDQLNAGQYFIKINTYDKSVVKSFVITK